MDKPRAFDGALNGTSPPTNTTFFIDSDAEDLESEASDSYTEPSPVESVESFNEQSIATVSPTSLYTTDASPTSRTIDDHDQNSRGQVFRLKSIKGRPSQEQKRQHLFRASLASSDDFAWQTYPGVAELPADSAQPAELPTDEPEKAAAAPKIQACDWSTQQVAAWMFNSGFETSTVSSFLTHDVNGSVLLNLTFDDLRELDIVSFGKRLQIWNEISALRRDTDPAEPLAAASSSRMERGGCNQTALETAFERTKRPSFQRSADDSLSIRLGGTRRLDQNVPKPHRCSKGKKCLRWKRQQDMINDVDREHGPMTPPTSQLDRAFELPVDAATDRRGRVSSKIVTDMDDDAFLRQLELPQNSSPRVKQYLQLQHIVHQVHEVPKASGASPHAEISPVSPQTPKGDVFFSQQNKPAEAFPPRFSSLNTLSNLDVPATRPKTPTRHTPSSSESTITTKREESPNPVEAHSRSSSAPPYRPFPPTSTGIRSQVPRSVTSQTTPATGSPAPRPKIGGRLRAPSSESDLRGTPGAILPNFEIPTSATGSPLSGGLPPKGRRPSFKSPSSEASLARKRCVQPLPTLVERASKVEVDKSLPPTPAKSTSSAESIVPPLPTIPIPGTASKASDAESTRLASTPEKRAERAHSAPNSRSATPQPASRGPSPVPIISPPAIDRKGSYTALDERKPSIVVPAVPAVSMATVFPLGAYGPDAIRAGWVRRRRSKTWRHEWSAVHLRLTSSTLGVYATAKPDDTNPLEIIDMDEYTIACCSGGASNKLAAAVRSLRTGAARSQSPGSSANLDAEHGAAFSWQLVPKAAVGEAANVKSVSTEKDRDGEEKTVVVGARDEAKVLKTHHFAVGTRDERIEWMRQVMLAQALRAKALGRKTERAGRGGDVSVVAASTPNGMVVQRCASRADTVRQTLEAIA